MSGYRINPELRLSQLGIVLPAPVVPVAAYVPVCRCGSFLFVSGQLPFCDGKLLGEGPVPSRVSPDQAALCARQCVINGLAAVRAALGSLNRVTRVVRLGVFVCSDPGFGGQPEVANGASVLLEEIFGPQGRHARAAVGCNALPRGACVEVEMTLEVV